MKTSCLAIVLLSAIVAGAQTPGTATQTTAGQPTLPPPTAYSVVANDANSRVWERTVYEQGPKGTVIPKKHRYTELAGGMYYQSNGQWVESKEEIDVLPQGGAAATQGQHQLYFPGDIYKGVIQMVTPDGQTLQSRPMGIFYDDGNSTVMIAALTNSVGELVSPNQVVYPDAFTGFKADLVCTYRKGSFECDLVFREQPHPPETYGLNSQNTRIELLTEFFNTPEPAQSQMGVDRQSGLSDTTLRFGSVIMDHGKAFIIGDASPSSPGVETPVFKSWLHLAGRTFLMEEVPFPKIAASLQSLPMTAMNDAVPADSILDKVSPTRLLVPARLAQKDGTHVVQLARADVNQERGVVMDYVAVTVDTNNFTFQSDTTYLVGNPGGINFYGTTTFEGGTVIKFWTNETYGCTIQSWNTNVCDTGPYRPAIFTSMNDNTVGESVAPGGPAMHYHEALAGDATTTTQWKYIHIRYADYGVQGNTHLSVSDSQFVNCGYPFFVYWGPCYLTNDLLVNIDSAFYGNDFQATAYHLTIDNCTNNQLVVDFYSEDASTVSFVNSLLVNVGADGDATITTNYTARVTAGSGIFQPVGAGYFYLATNSIYHNAGTTNINAGILADIATKTTYPPIVYSNQTISANTTFSPQAWRDAGAMPDLGYHYDPIDYFFGGVTANSNVTFTIGTAFGWFELPGSGGPGYGIALNNDIFATFNGTATSPCIFTRYDTVQEGGNGLWTDKGFLGGMVNGGSDDPSNPAGLTATFTHFSQLANDPNHFRDGISGQAIVIQAKDCEIYGSAGGYNILGGYTNCLFYRSGFGIETGSAYPYQIYINCTFYGGNLGFGHGEGSYYGDGPPYWYSYIHNCAFDGTTFSIDDPFGSNTNYADYNYNAFDSGAAQPPTEGANTVTVTGGFNWQSSWFGNFYLSTSSTLINAGDRTADQIGLYHFTIQTNQVPETNSVVDIGYHYVATDAYGNPLDTNGDGIPDYLEDVNGNGLVDSGEIGWNIFGDPGLSIIITQPRNGGTMP